MQYCVEPIPVDTNLVEPGSQKSVEQNTVDLILVGPNVRLT